MLHFRLPPTPTFQERHNRSMQMSHVVKIRSELVDNVAIGSSCQRLKLPPPTHGTAKLFGSEATGTIVQLPGWQYPVVIDTTTGEVKYDNYEGQWGDIACLHAFLQAYTVEKAKLEARKA